jgi:hypothetical protein
MIAEKSWIECKTFGDVFDDSFVCVLVRVCTYACVRNIVALCMLIWWQCFVLRADG